MDTTPRKNRIDSLCAEVEILTLCQSGLPEGPARSDITDEITSRMTEIDRLSQPVPVGSPARQRGAYAVSVLMVLWGLLAGSYAPVVLGAFVAFFALTLLDSPPEH